MPFLVPTSSAIPPAPWRGRTALAAQGIAVPARPGREAERVGHGAAAVARPKDGAGRGGCLHEATRPGAVATFRRPFGPWKVQRTFPEVLPCL